jgi:FixJ family two-component response regulator
MMFSKRAAHAATLPAPPRVLAILASTADRAQLESIFKNADWAIVFADGVPLTGDQPPIVLYDRDIPGSDWRQSIQKLAGGPHPRKVILASFVADDYLWEEVIHCGGYDILPKPFRETEVRHVIQFAWASVTKSLPSEQRTK